MPILKTTIYNTGIKTDTKSKDYNLYTGTKTDANSKDYNL